MKVKKCWYLVALVLLAGASGCNSKLVPLTGRLTYKGEPVPSTEVFFQPDDGSRRSVGLTDDDGRFHLRYSLAEEGVTRGRHTVCLRYAPSAEEETGQISPKASKELQAVVAKYRDPAKSDLHVEVTKSGQFVEIKLGE
jgi:hypothetical protein